MDESPSSAAPETERRRLAEETMASWALEGMEPSAGALERMGSLVDGELSTDEFIAAAKAARRTDVRKASR